jgi:hypothetical protein
MKFFKNSFIRENEKKIDKISAITGDMKAWKCEVSDNSNGVF